jgi:succinoglycan biosynthesis transport protein ExoP
MDPNNVATFPNPMMNQDQGDIIVGPRPLAASPSGHAVQPQILTGHPNLRNLLVAFRRRWRLGVSLGLVTAVIAAAATYFFTMSPSWTATAQVRVTSQQTLLSNYSQGGGYEQLSYLGSQRQLIKSRRVSAGALRDPKVAQMPIVLAQPDPIEWLESQILVDFSGELINIRTTGKDDKIPLEIVRAVRTVYLEEVVDAERKQRTDKLQKLQDILREKEKLLKEAKTALNREANITGSRQAAVLALKMTLEQTELHQIQTELLTLQASIRREQVEEMAKPEGEKSLQSIVPSADEVEEIINKKPEVAVREKEIAAMEELLVKYRERSTPTNLESDPVYKGKQKQLADAKKNLAAFRDEWRPKVEAELRVKHDRDLQLSSALHEDKLAKLKRQEAVLQKMVDVKSSALDSFGKKTNIIEELSSEIASVEGLTKRLGDMIQQSDVENRAPERVTAYDDPFVTKRDGLAYKATPVAALAGFLIVALGVAYLEFRSRRLSDVSDVSRGLRLHVLGTMPLVRSKASSGSASADAFQQQLIESVDTARTMLQHQFRRKNLRVVMVTSANSGEGKTLLSAHLAASLARAGWRTLLVDGDLRRPSLHKVFGLEMKAGLGEALRGEIGIRDQIAAGPVEGLSVLTAGRGDSGSLRALAQGKLVGLFAEIKQDYDFIVLDSAPILPVADSQLMAQAVDGVILSALQNVSRLPTVHAVAERLALYQVNLVGVVLHGNTSESYYSQYPYMPFISNDKKEQPKGPTAKEESRVPVPTPADATTEEEAES